MYTSAENCAFYSCTNAAALRSKTGQKCPLFEISPFSPEQRLHDQVAHLQEVRWLRLGAEECWYLY